MILLELFKETYGWTHGVKMMHGAELPTWLAKFDTDAGQKYDIVIGQDETCLPGEVLIDFRLMDGGNGTWKLSGTGDAFKVMGTVKLIVQTYLDEVAPAFATFSADNDEPSRIRLYNRLFQTMAGYRLETSDEGDHTQYTLRKGDAAA